VNQLTHVRDYDEVVDASPPDRIRSTGAVEGAMLKANPWNNSVPRVEYDHRMREARLRFERLERLLVKQHAVKDSRPFRLFRLLAISVSGSGRRGDLSTGSSSDRRPCHLPMLLPVS